MKLSFIEPRAELKPFIQCFVVFESPIGMPASGTHLVAPDGCPRLIITIENSITSICKERSEEIDEGSMYFVGNRDSSILLQTKKKRTSFIAIEFFPNGAYPFTLSSARRIEQHDNNQRRSGYKYVKIMVNGREGRPKLLPGCQRDTSQMGPGYHADPGWPRPEASTR